MTTDQIILFVIFGGVFALLLWGRYRYDLVAFGALLIGVLAGVVESKDAFSGFGHPATLVVALVLIVSAGLVNSGAVGSVRICSTTRWAVGLTGPTYPTSSLGGSFDSYRIFAWSTITTCLPISNLRCAGSLISWR